MKVEIELTPKQVEICRDWAEYWINNSSGESYGNPDSILAKVAMAVTTYDLVYLEAIS